MEIGTFLSDRCENVFKGRVKIYPLISRIPEWWILTSEWVQTRAGGVVFRTDLDLAVPLTSGSTWSRNQFEH